MGRFYVPRESVSGDTIVLDGAEAHHALSVMRLKKLDKVCAFDGEGNEYNGFINDIKGKTLTIQIKERRRAALPDGVDITLIQAIPKKEKMEHIVEKATELGAHSIIPVFTERTIPDWDGAKRSGRVERWRKIAKEASKQCGRSDIPQIADVIEFCDAVKKANDRDLKLMAALSEEAIFIKDALAGFKGGNAAVAIGPEGDFTQDEVAWAKDAGFKVIGLGPRVLKCDTAAISVLSIVSYELTL